MSIRADTFKQAVRTAASDYYGLTSQDIKNLGALFGSLDGSNRKEALGYLLEANYTSLYSAVCRESVPGSLSLSTFTKGVSAADDRYYGIDRQERDNLKDAFSRLNSQDQGRALEYLLSNNYNTLLAEVERVANRSAGVGFAGFKAGVQAADDRYYGIDRNERNTLGDAFCRLTTQDQSRALEYVLKCNYTALFNEIEGSAGKAASIGLKGFTEGVRAADDRYYGIDSTERAALSRAFRRMGASDQGRALEYALAHNYTALYTALDSVAHKSAAISLGGFQSAVRAADDRYYGIDASERAVLRSAFGRLSRADQEQARVWVLSQNYQSLFAQLEGVRSYAKAAPEGDAQPVETFSETDTTADVGPSEVYTEEPEPSVADDLIPKTGFWKRLLHPNDPEVKLGREVEKARGELRGLVIKLDDALTQTEEAATRLQTAIERQEGVVAKYEQEARAAMASGGKEAARPAGLKLLQAKKDLEALQKSLSEVQAQAQVLTEREDVVLAQYDQLETDALSNLARLNAAEARAQAADVVAGVDGAMSKVAESIERVDAKARDLVQHAEAVEGLQESGVLDQVRGDGSATPELDRLMRDDEVDQLLATLG